MLAYCYQQGLQVLCPQSLNNYGGVLESLGPARDDAATGFLVIISTKTKIATMGPCPYHVLLLKIELLLLQVDKYTV